MMFIIKHNGCIYTQAKAIFISHFDNADGEGHYIKADIDDKDGYEPILYRGDNSIQVDNMFDDIFRYIKSKCNTSTIIIDFDKIQHMSDNFYGKDNDYDKKTAKETSSKQPD